MKHQPLIPGLLIFLTATACAQEAPEFVEVDADKDGILSIEEAKEALPMVTLSDSNGDGFVNQEEAEAAIPGLMFAQKGYTGGAGLVSEFEFRLITETLASQEDDS